MNVVRQIRKRDERGKIDRQRYRGLNGRAALISEIDRVTARRQRRRVLVDDYVLLNQRDEAVKVRRCNRPHLVD